MLEEQLAWCRQQFPALQPNEQRRTDVFFDGPAGTQVPQRVIDAMTAYLSQCNANRGGRFATSRRSDEWLDQAHRAVADLLGTPDPAEVAFGANMTSLTFALSRALARTWRAGDEVLVTRLEHDANFTPWKLAAADAGVRVHEVQIHPDDCTLDLDDLRSKLSTRTRLVAVGCASNATGTRNDVQQICRWAREAGALSFLDAVHLAPHDRMDVAAWGCDFLVCSAYKFFGPHVGILWGRRELLETLTAYKLRPAPDALPGKWMTGTQNHEGIVGAMAAIDYLADLGCRSAGDATLDRTRALDETFRRIVEYERRLVWQMIDGLRALPGVRIWGITDRTRAAERLPTVAWTHERRRPQEIAELLGERGFSTWHGNYYALPLTEALQLEPDGMVRIGIVHYNTSEEVDALLQAIATILR